jgi:septal ring factor EnvC (AmiA/AmiB activator)
MSDDTFTAVAGLVALITDVKGCAKRLAELQATIVAAETAQAQLEAARIANERAFSEMKADLDRRQARLVEGEVELRLRLSAFNQREASRDATILNAADYPENPNLLPGTQCRGLLRERHYD